ncbi:hypothetical protein Hore_02170 [Halothermothrix orenii H 168]|uniref:Uncharacterized protein n=1 Tax=Halothermothrix orenii (strain H 168 / OCM 544 / DSM 9562) TaxID=373903 RepID=B8D109_HALOH|nr:hypothetical protein Hore_02170 [Halothermothrix orenii H 168]
MDRLPVLQGSSFFVLNRILYVSYNTVNIIIIAKKHPAGVLFTYL